MKQTLKFGSLYLDNSPTNIDAEYQAGQTISFGSATPNKIISWVPVNGLLIADQCLLTKISWDDLDAQGLVFGREINIQGFRFKIRLLKVGTEEGVSNEWDAALDIVGENNTLWNWDAKYFWGQESTARYASFRAYRGYDSARFWNYDNASTRYAFLGFRPVLEPLHAAPSALRPGQKVLVIGYDGCVMGRLVEKTQYDLILQLKPSSLVGKAAFTADLQDGSVVVDRSGILGITAA